MKNITIKCITNANINSCNIIIKDKEDNILLDKKTNNLEELNFSFYNDTIYKIIIMSQLYIVYINDNIEDKLVFYIGNTKRKCNKIIPITIKITDSYYKDLPIMKGNIYVKRNINSNYKW